jgi:hypothetical protein
MSKAVLFARLQAKPGKQTEVEQFLQKALAMAKDEKNTSIAPTLPMRAA